MKLHRFYVPNIELKHNFWLQNHAILHQWRNVLRFQAGQEVVLFDGQSEDRLYRIAELTEREAHLEYVTDMKRQIPAQEVYLLWSLLKKDKNDWVLQKGTELGVS
ncbi:MAG TPA: RNA methyltransferase PUA domain-containing protein, partial [Patescibacteria group bacterium]|nr:RNA methyltransferase PUA domain-containing protein [Patescibacteria group bacterium]